MSSTPTPLDDNQRNSNDERMYSAIDNVMNNSEQTYEDFINSFTQLKKEDLVSKKLKQVSEGCKKSENKPAQPVEEHKSLTEEFGPNNEEIHVLAEKAEGTDSTDELAEEVLEPGEVCGWMSQAGNQSSSVQFDNFVETEDNEISAEISVGYTASFAAGPLTKPTEKQQGIKAREQAIDENKKKRDIKQPEKQHTDKTHKELKKEVKESDHNKKKRDVKSLGKEQPTDKAKKENRKEVDDVPSAQESIEAMKNILLETFLSDFCEEMGLGSVPGMGLDTLTEMNLDENDENLDQEDVNFDDDPLELLMSITDTGASTANSYVKESILKSNVPLESEAVVNKKKKARSRRRKRGKKKPNLEQNTDNQMSDRNVSQTESESKTESHSDQQTNNEVETTKTTNKEKVDMSESKLSDIDSENRCIEEHHPTHDGLIERSDISQNCEENFDGKIIYPGEVDDDVVVSDVSKETRLEFKATFRASPDTNSSTTQDSNDMVEPFVLDQDFDYDNVVLTPKYSAEDMERLSQLMTAKVIV